MQVRSNSVWPRVRLFAVAVVLQLLFVACAEPKGSHYPTLVDREFFLCCTLRFNADHEANDAGYTYPEETLIRAGTRARVLEDFMNQVRLQFPGDPQIYRLNFRHGRDRMTAEQWFRLVLLDDDPRAHFASLSPDVLSAIDAGRLLPGMTKWEAATARGYPPFHRTTSPEADEWTYYTSRDVVDVVRFVDGRIASITPGPAPGS
jgi:hypothetical protein